MNNDELEPEEEREDGVQAIDLNILDLEAPPISEESISPARPIRGSTAQFLDRLIPTSDGGFEISDERINEVTLNASVQSANGSADLEAAIRSDLEMEAVVHIVEAEETPDKPEIPINSNTLLVKEETSRFKGAIWYEAIQKKSVTLAGLGGIGSYIGFLLARMQPSYMYLYDDDTVEAANMSGQLYGMNDIGKSKIYSLMEAMKNYANFYQVGGFFEKFTRESSATDIMICGFDNMEARKTFFKVWWNRVIEKSPEEKKNCLFIDGRLAAEEFQIYALTGDNQYAINKYQQECLFSDAEADETLCSYKQTTFCANMIASYIVNIFVNFVANGCPENIMPRSVPFYTTYNAETMYLKIEE